MEGESNNKGWAQRECPHPRERGPPCAQGFPELAKPYPRYQTAVTLTHREEEACNH
jgi:hypothetical protein